jgi:hypothetical protein
MNGVDMHIAEFYPQSDSRNYMLFDAYSENNSEPPADTDLGGTDDLLNRTYDVVNGKPVITYTRLLKTGDSKDKNLNIVNVSNIEF